MNSLQRAGGIAALVNGVAYIIGLSMALTVLAPILNAEPAEYAAYLADNLTLMYLWHLILYIVAGVAMVPLVQAFHQRLRGRSPALMGTATAMGYIWAGLVIAAGMLLILSQEAVVAQYGTDPGAATTLLSTLSVVVSALGGGIELPGGVWIGLISLAAWRGTELPRGLNVLGLLIGAAGILTAVPVLQEAGILFGLGFVVWFLWAGIHLLRDRNLRPAAAEPRAHAASR